MLYVLLCIEKLQTFARDTSNCRSSLAGAAFMSKDRWDCSDLFGCLSKPRGLNISPFAVLATPNCNQGPPLVMVLGPIVVIAVKVWTASVSNERGNFF